MAFEATEAFPFDRSPTSSRHFNATPRMMNFSRSTSTHDGEMRDIDDIQREDAQNPADAGHSNVPLALNLTAGLLQLLLFSLSSRGFKMIDDKIKELDEQHRDINNARRSGFSEWEDHLFMM
ncbi:hypothetical protein Scep_013062 [Stephania cephalantha]|uniref:Uncharacterized protein n=1 Tax=Stephania cephalantha TaxID=152367 RepID=A0AAP0JGM3_9MAGN